MPLSFLFFIVLEDYVAAAAPPPLPFYANDPLIRSTPRTTQAVRGRLPSHQPRGLLLRVRRASQQTLLAPVVSPGTQRTTPSLPFTLGPASPDSG